MVWWFGSTSAADEAVTECGPVETSSGSHVLSGFDPTVLERGAKALKELDSSHNAAKAFEIIKTEQQTKQQELQYKMKQSETEQERLKMQRLQYDTEEKRKQEVRRREHERASARYKAQLEAESHRQKLKEQQQANEEWLRQQHQQFLKQENYRKQNESELIALREKQVEKEKALEKEITVAKQVARSEGRIKNVRANADVHMMQARQRLEIEGEQKLHRLRFVFLSIGNALSDFLRNKARVQASAGAFLGLTFGYYAVKNSSIAVVRQLEASLCSPTLVRETSRFSLLHRYEGYLPWFLRRVRFHKKLQEEIVLPKDLSQRLEWTANSIRAARHNGLPFRHVLLYGKPGTGKTLFARTLAKENGMDYAIMTGGDVGALGKRAVTEIQKLFKWGRKSKRGLILFIDEAEAFLKKGREQGDMSEDWRDALAAFLHQTGSEDDTICLVLATNLPHTLESAVLDRMDDIFEFPLPGLAERIKMLNSFFDRYVHQQKGRRKIILDPLIDQAYLEEVAARCENFSGRQLSKLVLSMQACVYGSGSKVLTRGLAETVLKWKLTNSNF